MKGTKMRNHSTAEIKAKKQISIIKQNPHTNNTKGYIFNSGDKNSFHKYQSKKEVLYTNSEYKQNNNNSLYLQSDDIKIMQKYLNTKSKKHILLTEPKKEESKSKSMLNDSRIIRVHRNNSKGSTDATDKSLMTQLKEFINTKYSYYNREKQRSISNKRCNNTSYIENNTRVKKQMNTSISSIRKYSSMKSIQKNEFSGVKIFVYKKGKVTDNVELKLPLNVLTERKIKEYNENLERIIIPKTGRILQLVDKCHLISKIKYEKKKKSDYLIESKVVNESLIKEREMKCFNDVKIERKNMSIIGRRKIKWNNIEKFNLKIIQNADRKFKELYINENKGIEIKGIKEKTKTKEEYSNTDSESSTKEEAKSYRLHKESINKDDSTLLNEDNIINTNKPYTLYHPLSSNTVNLLLPMPRKQLSKISYYIAQKENELELLTEETICYNKPIKKEVLIPKTKTCYIPPSNQLISKESVEEIQKFSLLKKTTDYIITDNDLLKLNKPVKKNKHKPTFKIFDESYNKTKEIENKNEALIKQASEKAKDLRKSLQKKKSQQDI